MYTKKINFVYNSFQLNWNETGFCLAANQSENWKARPTSGEIDSEKTNLRISLRTFQYISRQNPNAIKSDALKTNALKTDAFKTDVF